MNILKLFGPSLFGLGLYILLIIGCVGPGSIPLPTQKYVEFANRNGHVTSLDSLTLGRSLFLQRCSECHNLKRPTKMPATRWPDVVRDMAVDGKIPPEQQKLITQYLVTVASVIEDSLSQRKTKHP